MLCELTLMRGCLHKATWKVQPGVGVDITCMELEKCTKYEIQPQRCRAEGVFVMI